MRMVVRIPSLILTAIGFCVASCNSNNMYKNYQNYGEGYKAAQKGKSQPSSWASKAEKEGYENGVNDLRTHNGERPTVVEFQYTQTELQSLENRWQTFDQMLEDALSGDRDALFGIGLSYLYGGKGLPIDVAKANVFFSKAAALGHAPSIDKIRAMYLEDNPNPFLHHVYVNLAIAMGHTEYTLQYHRIRSEMLEKFGKPVVEEIERIAQEKLETIYANLDDLEHKKKSKDTDMYFLELNDITFMDSRYDLPHWLSIAGVADK